MIPAMILGMTGTQGGGASTPMFSNAWQMIAVQTPLYVVSNIGEYANMSMVFIFGGIMVSIFIGQIIRAGM